MSTTVIAVLCSDLHLCHRPPRARMGTTGWYNLMQLHLCRLRDLSYAHRAPIICAGDVLDTWAAPPELINWVLRYLPNKYGFYAIPGQHDLPNHRLEDMRRSAYSTLVQAGAVTDLTPTDPAEPVDYIETPGGQLAVGAFPWGAPVQPLGISNSDGTLGLAVVHAYCWQGKVTSYPGATPGQQATAYRKQLGGWDVALFGDNHKGFYIPGRPGQCAIFNHGGFIPRNADERYNVPALGLLHSDGTVELVHAGPEPDGSWAEEADIGTALPGIDLGDFVAGCRRLGGAVAPFLEQLGTAANTHPVAAVGQAVQAIREVCIAERQGSG